MSVGKLADLQQTIIKTLGFHKTCAYGNLGTSGRVPVSLLTCVPNKIPLNKNPSRTSSPLPHMTFWIFPQPSYCVRSIGLMWHSPSHRKGSLETQTWPIGHWGHMKYGQVLTEVFPWITSPSMTSASHSAVSEEHRALFLTVEMCAACSLQCLWTV